MLPLAGWLFTPLSLCRQVYIQHVKVDTGDVDHPAQDEAQRDLTAMLLLDSSMNAQAEFYEPLACIKIGKLHFVVSV